MKRGTNPKSLANLKAPIQKGEVRNPEGVNSKGLYTDRHIRQATEKLKDSKLGLKLRDKLELPEDATWADAEVKRAHVEAGFKGSVKHLGEISDRVEGRATMHIEHTGAGGGPVYHTIRFGDGDDPHRP